jgi:hypothetical protein
MTTLLETETRRSEIVRRAVAYVQAREKFEAVLAKQDRKAAAVAIQERDTAYAWLAHAVDELVRLEEASRA